MHRKSSLWIEFPSGFGGGDLSVLHTTAEDRDGLLKPENKYSPGRPNSVPL